MSSRRADGAAMVRFLHKLSPRELKRTCRNAAIDLQYGGFSGGYIRNPAPGAHGTGATDYDIMPHCSPAASARETCSSTLVAAKAV